MSVDELIVQNIDWARSVVRVTRHRFNLLTPLEDLESAGLEALVNCARRYNPGSVPFRAYARRRISGAVLDLVNDETAPSRFSLLTRQIDDEAGFYLPDHRTPLDALETSRALARADDMIRELPPRLREVLWFLIVEGLSLEEVGQRIGVTYQRVWQIKDEALQLLRDAAKTRDDG